MAASATTEFDAGRTKGFTDGVVAIALTLLILPLMDSVSDVASEGASATTWVIGHGDQLRNFLLSFALIALFWMIHHSLFSTVQRVTPALIWLLAAWMLTIVWLPVATAVSGQMSDDDAGAKVIYVGGLALTALMSLAIRLYLRGHPSLHSTSESELLRGMAVDLSMVALFLTALAIALLFPAVGYYALLIMLLSGVAERIARRVLGRAAPD